MILQVMPAFNYTLSLFYTDNICDILCVGIFCGLCYTPDFCIVPLLELYQPDFINTFWLCDDVQLLLICLGKILHVYFYMHVRSCTRMYCVCVNLLNWTPVWLAPGDTQNSEFVCFFVLFQTIDQMLRAGPTTLK